MPTESQYRSAAEDFRIRARSYDDAVAWAPRQPARQFTGDGPIADRIDGAFGDVLGRLGSVAVELRAVAGECERRADVCRSYRMALSRYHALPLHIRELTPRPVRPASWVDV